MKSTIIAVLVTIACSPVLASEPSAAPVTAALITANSTIVQTPPALPVPASSRPFAAFSPFNTPISANPAVHPHSSAIIAKAVSSPQYRVLANSDAWGISVTTAKTSDPLNTVSADRYGADYDPGQFRIPANAQPTAGDDHHLAIIDGNSELDQWVARRVDAAGWVSGTRYKFDLAGSGIAPGGKFGQTAANFALTAGLIRPEEIAAGVIDHALAFTTPQTRNEFVCPATHGDGRQTTLDSIPIGARIQLDPTINVSLLPIPDWQKVIARALQVYGAYCADSSGAFAFRGEASIGRSQPDIWVAVGVSGDSPQINAPFPWDSLRVLAW